MANAKHQKEIQIVNGLKRGNVAKALRGEHVGTIVYAD
jgi:molybdenum storage protein